MSVPESNGSFEVLAQLSDQYVRVLLLNKDGTVAATLNMSAMIARNLAAQVLAAADAVDAK